MIWLKAIYNFAMCPELIQSINPTMAVSHREEKGLPFVLILHTLQVLNSMRTKLHFWLFIRLIFSWCIAVPSSKQKDYPVLQDILMGSNSPERSASMERAEHYNCTRSPSCRRGVEAQMPHAPPLWCFPNISYLSSFWKCNVSPVDQIREPLWRSSACIACACFLPLHCLFILLLNGWIHSPRKPWCQIGYIWMCLLLYICAAKCKS